MEGGKIRREMSPERSKMCVETRLMNPTFKKVQVVYYLSRNGYLQHPHFLELTHLAHQQLRLKDVLDRLTLLRGKAMPLIYSWSCKRSYKNGYVWNDLAQNDVIFPSQGGEYVLKGSEIVADCTEKLQQIQIDNVSPFQDGSSHHGGDDSEFYPKRRISASKPPIDGHTDEDDGEKAMHTTCSRGVSTDEIEEEVNNKQTQMQSSHTELNHDPSSPPSTASSTVSDNNPSDHNAIENEPMLSRNSMLFNLIACGGSGSFRKAVLPSTAGRKSCSGSGLHKGAAAEEEDRLMINYMSENPRFGNLQAEEKEYFSGSIAEQISNHHHANQPPLNKSSSYNQDRCAKGGIGGGGEEEVAVKKEQGFKGKCIPRKRKSSSKMKH